jgi:MoxR-like ATPase
MGKVINRTKDKINNVMDDLNNSLLERREVVRCAMLALLTGEHFLQLGPPGVAKSKTVREIRKRITGCGYFEKLLSQTTAPDEVFGPVDLVKLSDKGLYVRVPKGSLSVAHIAFLDEIFKANSVVLNSLLTIVNERLMHEVGFDPVQVPLISLFAASNEVPQEDILAAFNDRFLVRMMVSSCVQENSFDALIEGNFDSKPQATFSLDDLADAQKQVKSVKITDEAKAAAKEIKLGLSNEGITVSDRKLVQVGKLMRAEAWLNGHNEVAVDDLECLVNALWTDPKEIKTTERVVFAIANPLNLKAVEMEDMAREVHESTPKEDATDFNKQIESTLQQLRDIHEQLQSAADKSKAQNKRRAEFALDRIADWHNCAGELALKHSKRLQFKL